MGQLRWACTLAVLATALGVPETRLRGVDPQLIHRYQSPGADFACLDGIKTIPKDHLNDEYCDCYDGSDEPGRRRPRAARCADALADGSDSAAPDRRHLRVPQQQLLLQKPRAPAAAAECVDGRRSAVRCAGDQGRPLVWVLVCACRSVTG